MTEELKTNQLECTNYEQTTNKVVPLNCVSLSLRTLFIMKILNNKTHVQLQISLKICVLAEAWELKTISIKNIATKVMTTPNR